MRTAGIMQNRSPSAGLTRPANISEKGSKKKRYQLPCIQTVRLMKINERRYFPAGFNREGASGRANQVLNKKRLQAIPTKYGRPKSKRYKNAGSVSTTIISAVAQAAG